MSAMDTMTLSSLIKRYFIFGLCTLCLTACQNTFDPKTSVHNVVEKRATLSDLVSKQTVKAIDSEVSGIEEQFVFSKEQRAIKLASLYQNILATEPSENIRTKIHYRLIQIDTQNYESQDQPIDLVGKDSKSLDALVHSYQTLLTRYPNRNENEEIHYLLAKALTLKGELDKSLSQFELILTKYPDTKYRAELHFRRGDIYYNLQHYTKALQEYQAVLKSKNNTAYYVNSAYMSGWSLFKLNRLQESDRTFISLLDFIIAQESKRPNKIDFSFSTLNNRYLDLVDDIQRVLSISLSQQNQAKSLVALVESYQGNEFKQNNLYLYRHLLFKNLADLLLENTLDYDAELTYQSFLTLAPNSVWAAKYSLLLIELYRKQGKHQAIRELKVQYVHQFGMDSKFWKQYLSSKSESAANKESLTREVLPNLLTFSYQHSRYLYANAQSKKVAKDKKKTFTNTAHWLKTYLLLARFPEAAGFISKITLSQGLLADELLFADASFEAELFEQALASYEYIAYQAPITSNGSEQLRKEAAYASTLTIRKMLELNVHENNLNKKQALLTKRTQIDKAYIENYPNNEHATALAVQLVQYYFSIEDHTAMQFYCDFVLQAHGVIKASSLANLTNRKVEKAHINHGATSASLNEKATKEVQIASQFIANYWYQQGNYIQSETSYNLALNYVALNSEIWLKMRELLAASIYFQGKDLALSQPLLAVEHYLRLKEQIPISIYSLNSHIDAANLLFEHQHWQEAIEVFLTFQQEHPDHEYSRSIPAKLAQSFENLEQWQMAAEQYLAISAITDQGSTNLQQEALYRAGELYLEAENLAKAISTFRTYAHTYPEPFDIAQEVRFKMSEFYQQTNEPIKEYYWYRKIMNFHDEKFKSPAVEMSTRAKYLASIASLGLGSAHQQTFKQINLTLPLKKSLVRKRKAMELAINHYKKLLSFQLAEFVPQGTYNLAQMYRQLSRDVMSSQRPKNLDEFALEEYDLLLEEIVYPFEDKAIEIHKSNAQLAWQNIYDEWIAKSFSVLAELEPALYDRTYKIDKVNKIEGSVDVIRTLH